MEKDCGPRRRRSPEADAGAAGLSVEVAARVQHWRFAFGTVFSAIPSEGAELGFGPRSVPRPALLSPSP